MSVEKQQRFPVVFVEGSSAFEIGKSVGLKIKDRIHKCVHLYREFFLARTGGDTKPIEEVVGCPLSFDAAC